MLKRKYGSRLVGLLLFVLAAAPGAAQAIEVGGQTLPVVPDQHTDCEGDVWVCINDHEDTLGYAGEDIDVVETATIDQETFNPLCNLTFEVLAKGASYINVFGWYEVRRAADGTPVAPAPEEMHVMLGCDTPVGQVVDLPNPDGITEIGFFLANNKSDSCVTDSDGNLKPTQENLFFSQPELNEDDGRVHLLIWQSRANPTAFYFGWEDQNGGGDNDFDDLLTFVTGIQCASGGDLCDTGQEGICANGIEQCRDGMLTCVGLQSAREETCNALDDDCDGETDEGEGLCADDEVCFRGACQPRCGGGEFKCAPPLVCGSESVCIAADCMDVECGDGEVCHDGECVGACDDVVCPYGAACRSGVCVDVCEGVECDDGFSCEVSYPPELDGAPVGICASCGCTGCDDGYSCEQNLCVEDECVDMSCNAGFRCKAGECVDNCDGAVCPAGNKCEDGVCVVDEDYAPSSEGGAAGEGGSPPTTISVGGKSSGGFVGTGGSGGGGGTQQGLEDDEPIVEPRGCGCMVVGSGRPGLPWLLSLGLALILMRRRRPDH